MKQDKIILNYHNDVSTIIQTIGSNHKNILDVVEFCAQTKLPAESKNFSDVIKHIDLITTSNNEMTTMRSRHFCIDVFCSKWAKITAQILQTEADTSSVTNPIFNPKNVFGFEDTIEQLEKYGKEMAMVSAIITDDLMQDLYAHNSTNGYIHCLDIISTWAKAFIDTYWSITDWEDFIYSDLNPFKEACCWDDVVIAWGRQCLSAW